MYKQENNGRLISSTPHNRCQHYPDRQRKDDRMDFPRGPHLYTQLTQFLNRSTFRHQLTEFGLQEMALIVAMRSVHPQSPTCDKIGLRLDEVRHKPCDYGGCSRLHVVRDTCKLSKGSIPYPKELKFTTDLFNGFPMSSKPSVVRKRG